MSRRFRYDLEAVRSLRSWERDHTFRRLAECERELAAAQTKARQLELTHREACAAAGRTWALFRDPAAHARLLHALAGEKAMLLQAVEVVRAREQAMTAARSACEQARVRLETIERHRDAAYRAHSDAELRREVARADDDWILRSSTREGVAV